MLPSYRFVTKLGDFRDNDAATGVKHGGSSLHSHTSSGSCWFARPSDHSHGDCCVVIWSRSFLISSGSHWNSKHTSYTRARHANSVHFRSLPETSSFNISSRSYLNGYRSLPTIRGNKTGQYLTNHDSAIREQNNTHFLFLYISGFLKLEREEYKCIRKEKDATASSVSWLIFIIWLKNYIKWY